MASFLSGSAISLKVVTPAKAGVQCFCSRLIFLDTGACPGPDPGFAGMTFVVNFPFVAFEQAHHDEEISDEL